MNVLVTGAFGYFGLAVVRHLAGAHRVTATGRPPRANVVRSVYAAIPAAVNVIPVDALSLTRLELRDCDAVVHLAGGGDGPGGTMADPAKAVQDNVASAQHVIRLALGRRCILASTIYVYHPNERPLCEADPCAPDTLYGATKWLAEAIWTREGGVALRFAHLYGSGAGVELWRDGVTERLARAANGGEAFVADGDGSHRLDLVHVEDACRAVALGLEAHAPPPVLNIGGGPPGPTILQLAEAFGVQATTRGASGGPTRCLDISQAERTLGWRPTVLLLEGAAGLLAMLR